MLISIIILAVVATLLILAEFFVPGGILGLIAAVMILAIVVMSAMEYGVLGGILASIGAVIYVILLLLFFMKIFPETPLGRWAVLKTSVGGSRDQPSPEREERETLKGRKGVTVTVLRPSGKAAIEGKRFDVVSESGMIDSGRKIVVSRVDGNRIVVRPDPAETEDPTRFAPKPFES